MRFHELDLDEELLKAIDDLGFEECTEVQAQCLAHSLDWRDITAQSQTGTGKTAAFLITILHHFSRRPQLAGRQALVVAPTRELAVQIEEEAGKLAKYLPYRAGSIYGGVGYAHQEKMLKENVEIIVGTPGRLIDLSKSGTLDLSNFGIVVIDEADRLFDMGFYPDIRYILQRTPPQDERLTMLFSATLSTSVRNISWQYMKDPAEIEVEPEHLTVREVDQEVYHVAREEKTSLLLGILRKEQPENALIFTNTKRAAELVAKKLKGNGYKCEFIMGDVPQRKRLRIINNLKSGDVPYLVATDVAARGLHIDDLDLVVNYDLPEDAESYVHRIGRTARAGRTGKAVSLACERFVYSLEAIQDLIGISIPVAQITDELLLDDRSHVSVRDLQYHGSSRDDGGPRGGRRKDGGRSSSAGPPRHPGATRPAGSRTRNPARHPSARDTSHAGGSNSGAPGKPEEAGADRPAAKSGSAKGGAPKGRAPKGRAPKARTAESGAKRDPQSDRSGGTSRPSKSAPISDRLEYYSQKYGEDFKHVDGPDRKSSSSRSSKRPTQGAPDKNARSAAEATQGTGKGAGEPKSRPVSSRADAQAGKKRGIIGAISKLFRKETEE